MVSHLISNVLSQLPCRDFLEMNRSAGLALGSISV